VSRNCNVSTILMNQDDVTTSLPRYSKAMAIQNLQDITITVISQAHDYCRLSSQNKKMLQKFPSLIWKSVQRISVDMDQVSEARQKRKNFLWYVSWSLRISHPQLRVNPGPSTILRSKSCCYSFYNLLTSWYVIMISFWSNLAFSTSLYSLRKSKVA